MKAAMFGITLLFLSIASAQEFGWNTLIPPGAEFLPWVIGGILAAGALAIAANAIAALVTPIPFIGPVLAFAIKYIFGQYQKWLTEQLPKQADQAWQATEAIAASAAKAGTVVPTPDQKKEAALTILQSQARDARIRDLEVALEAAHTRNKAGGLEIKQ